MNRYLIVALFAGLTGGAVTVIAAPDQIASTAFKTDAVEAVGASPETLFQVGLKLQQEGEKAEDPQVMAPLLRQAIEQYQCVLALKPQAFPAQLMYAHCLAKLISSAADSAERLTLARQARERFAEAAHCPGADWKVFYGWALLLNSQAKILATGEQSWLRVMEEASRLFERSLDLASFSGDKAVVARDYGVCLFAIAERSDDPAKRRRLYKQAVAQFDFAVERSPQKLTGRYYGLWGTALLQVAKIDNDRMLMRTARERLLTSLEMQPDNTEARYNLSCAYALLDQPDAALRHLSICFQNDDAKRTIYCHAANDPDLLSLRRNSEYNGIFASETNSLMPDIKPRISDW